MVSPLHSVDRPAAQRVFMPPLQRGNSVGPLKRQNFRNHLNIPSQRYDRE